MHRMICVAVNIAKGQTSFPPAYKNSAFITAGNKCRTRSECRHLSNSSGSHSNTWPHQTSL